MTIETALANFAAAYRAYQIAKGATFNIEVATAYATQDVFNQFKGWADAVAVIEMETEDLIKATKVAA